MPPEAESHTAKPRQQRLYAAIAALVLLLLAADHLGLFHGIDTYLYDLSFRLRGSREVSQQVVIAAVDEKSLQQLGRWPLARRHYAHFLDRLPASAVVGFDLIMAEPTADDPLLAKAIRRQGQVILPAYLDNTTRRIDPHPLFKARGTGHIHVEQGMDSVSRDMFHTIVTAGTPLPSLTSLMLATAVGRPPELPPPVLQSDAAATLHQPHRINFYGPSGTFRRVSLADVINGDYPPEFFRNRYVLVGLTATGIVDEVATPFSQNRNRMPGIEVHANILENLLDGTMIREVPDTVRWLAALISTLLLAFFFRRLHEIPATILCVLTVTAMPALSLTLFVFGNIWLPPALFAAAFIMVYIVTYLQRLDEAARTLDRKYAALIDHLGPSTEDSSPPTTGLAGYLTEGGIDSKVARLLKVEQRYETILEETVQQRTQELSSALSLLSRVSDEMIIRLTKAVESRDEGTGDHVLRVGLYAREMATYLKMPEEFIDCITFASAMHDIGKIGIPDHVLLKPDHLTDEEMAVMKTHCLIGHRILSESPYPKLQMSAVIALTHHERWDGAGYPGGLSGEEIPLETRIFVIGDCYDALRSQRHYKPAWSHGSACAALLDPEAGQFDPHILEAFSVIAPRFAAIFDSHPNRTPNGNLVAAVH